MLHTCFVILQNMYGIDIAQERIDEQDKQILVHVLTAEWKNKRALILGSGKGRIGIMLAILGFEVVCVDIENYAPYYQEVNKLFNFKYPITFIEHDLGEYKSLQVQGIFSLVLMQRVLHYLPYNVAQELLAFLPKLMSKKSYLYSAVSCIDSEMGTDYSGTKLQINERFHSLSDEMQRRFDLYVPVCLYSLKEFRELMKQTHFKKKKIYQTSFGNIKSLYEL